MNKLKNFISILVILAFPLQVLAQIEPGFNPDKLIDDKVFADTQTFGGPEGVQKFLEVKNSVLADTSLNFLTKLKEPDNTLLKTGLEDPRPNLGRLRTAAELIWDASRQSGLNPQVIIVTLNKEQGLITSANDFTPERLQKALDRAMGFDCPDASGCGNLFPGFYYQLFGNFDAEGNRYLGATKSLMKSYTATGGRGPQINGQVSRVGDVITLDNTTGGPYDAPPSQTLTLMNQATAALYRYTPHVFNGNYNFWKFFNSWFRYPNGTLLSLANDLKTYIIQNGTKQLVPDFVAKQRGLDLTQKIMISPNEFESYPTDKIFAPSDNTVVRLTGDDKAYVFISGVKHPASAFVLGQRGLDAGKALSVTPEEAALFDLGSVLPPQDGTVIRGAVNQAVYLVENGQIKLFSEFTFKQRKITPKQIVIVPDDEIPTYTRQGFVSPLDGTLVKASDSTTVYLMEAGFKKPLTAELFKNRGLSFKNTAVLTSEEVGALPIGAFATPKNQTFFALDSKTGPLYIFKDGTKHPISSFVAKQRRITPDYIFTKSMAVEWFDGIPIPPKDGTLLKGQSSGTVYLVSKGQLRPLSAKAFKARGYKASRISILPQDEIDAYAKGEALLK
ncbi:MAG: hypothetical protein M1333_02290 [Patescibacteria group bacterium]|nr:hypothetical protein [Patescibacteria group bacterium]